MKIADLINDMKKDAAFSEAYKSEGEKLQTAIALYKAREEPGLAQVGLAERAKIIQDTIARIDRGDNISFEKFSAITQAMGKELKIESVSIKQNYSSKISFIFFLFNYIERTIFLYN